MSRGQHSATHVGRVSEEIAACQLEKTNLLPAPTQLVEREQSLEGCAVTPLEMACFP